MLYDQTFAGFVASRQWSDDMRNEMPAFRHRPYRWPGFIYLDCFVIEEVTNDWPIHSQGEGRYFVDLCEMRFQSDDLGDLERKLFEWVTANTA